MDETKKQIRNFTTTINLYLYTRELWAYELVPLRKIFGKKSKLKWT